MKYKIQFFRDDKWYTWCVMSKQEWAKECVKLLKLEYKKTRVLPQGEEKRMYEISGIYAVKFYPDGSVSRTKKVFKMVLNTESGVMAFLDEQKPFQDAQIKDVETGKDLTEYFLGEKCK